MSDITQTIRRQAQENRKRAEELKTEIDELDNQIRAQQRKFRQTNNPTYRNEAMELLKRKKILEKNLENTVGHLRNQVLALRSQQGMQRYRRNVMDAQEIARAATRRRAQKLSERQHRTTSSARHPGSVQPALVIGDDTSISPEDEEELERLEREMGGPSSSSDASSVHPTLAYGHHLHDMAQEMRDRLATSEQITRELERELAERNEEVRRIGQEYGINVDELVECPPSGQQVVPPIGPPPAQPSNLKKWLKKLWQSINCAGPQGGKKTRKHKKYRKRTKKYHKQSKKSRKYKNKKYRTRTRKH